MERYLKVKQCMPSRFIGKFSDFQKLIKIMNEIIAELNYGLTKAKALSLIGDELPKELILSINKMMCDYNEALKKESDGK